MDLIIGFVLAILGIIAAALPRQLGDEFKAWVPWIIKRLVTRAAGKLPEEQRHRYQEEWLSHISEIPGEVGKLIAALGLLPAARWMSSEGTSSNHVFDTFAAGFWLVMCGALFVVTALLIKVEDGGPIFVRQEVKGRDGRSVPVFKFRTMTFSGPPRHTQVGELLRRFDLDVLPALITVLRGDLAFRDLKQIIARLDRDKD
jgi:hypothetical protein